jgi:MFS family permease
LSDDGGSGNQSLSQRFYGAFPALAIPNYRLFMSGQAISLIGTWMQGPVLSWVVYDLTKSHEALGVVSFLQQFPMTILVIVAGVAADRYSRQRLITFTQSWLMLVALFLGILTVTGNLSIHWIYICAVAMGLAQAIDVPARQAFMVEVAGRKALGSAIALNSAVFNTARVIGPSIGGYVLAAVGAAWCFFINSASFLAVIAALVALRGLHYRPQVKKGGSVQNLLDGLKYVWRHGDIRIILVLTAAFSLFGTYYATLLPAFAREVYGKGEEEYGLLISALGVGALLGALFMAATTRAARQHYYTLFGMGIMVAALTLLAFNVNYPIACLFYAIHGFGMIGFLIAGNILVQHLSAPEYQGRTMGARHFVFGGMWTFGSLLAGYLPKYIGLDWTVASGAIVMLAALLVCVPRVLKIDTSVMAAAGESHPQGEPGRETLKP